MTKINLFCGKPKSTQNVKGLHQTSSLFINPSFGDASRAHWEAEVFVRNTLVRAPDGPSVSSRVQGPGPRAQGPGSRVQGPGPRVQGPGSRAWSRRWVTDRHLAQDMSMFPTSSQTVFAPLLYLVIVSTAMSL